MMMRRIAGRALDAAVVVLAMTVGACATQESIATRSNELEALPPTADPGETPDIVPDPAPEAAIEKSWAAAEDRALLRSDPRMRLAVLAAHADTIVTGRVASVSYEVRDVPSGGGQQTRLPFTRMVIESEKVHRGNVKATEFLVEITGGMIGDTRVEVSSQPWAVEGQDVIVFAAHDGPVLRTVGNRRALTPIDADGRARFGHERLTVGEVEALLAMLEAMP